MVTDQHTNRKISEAGGSGDILPQLSVPGTAFAIAFPTVLAFALIQSAKPFYYDSGGYWLLGETFVIHGHFSLLNFNNSLRGYILPLIDHGLHTAAIALALSSSGVAKLFNALLFALIGAVLAPRLAEIAWPERHWSISRRLALVVPLMVFWSGYLNFPLSDFLALAMVLLAFIAAARADSPGWMLVAGIATGAAIDTRPSYVLLLLLVPILIVCAWIERRDHKRTSMVHRGLCLGLLLAGFLIVSLPQSLASHRHFATWSFLPGTAAHLESLQLTVGLHTQRYETFVGSGHPPQMFYEDKAGLQLLSKEPGATVSGVSPY